MTIREGMISAVPLGLAILVPEITAGTSGQPVRAARRNAPERKGRTLR